MADIVNQPQTGGNNNRALIIALIVVAVALGGYLLLRNNNNQLADSTQSKNSTMTEDSMESTQPAQTPADTGQTTTTPPATTPPAQTVRTFTVKGSNFAFAPSQIQVKKGDKVKIVFENTGGFHDFVMDEFNVKTAQIPSGQSATVEFTADKAGSFEYYCSVGTHRQMGMKGTLIVE